MRWVLSLIVTIGLVGCRKETSQAQSETKTEPKAAAKKPTPPKAFTNTLGMKSVPVAGTGVQFSIWETRVKDYAEYTAANTGGGYGMEKLRV